MTQPNKHANIQHAKQIYMLENWGEGYFAINAQGHVCVHPHRDTTQTGVDLYEIAQSVQQSGLSMPILVRFTDILQDRVKRLQWAFQQACQQQAYSGHYTAVYPIKVNQQASVIQSMLDSGKPAIGLEAGSKPELLALMALSSDHLIICNGYKDRAYLRLALMGQNLGMPVWLVIEKLSELDLIVEQAKALTVKPLLGVRIRLSSISSGQWQNSGGEKSKFGLHAADLLQLLERLKQAKLLDSLKLMHFHMGSQIANINDIQTALQEAGRYFVELHRLGVAIHTVDLGGGLGIDYEGSRSNNNYSINYSIEEYARTIVRTFQKICTEHQLPQPNLITESGRAMTAHHALLITNVVEVESITTASPPSPPHEPSLPELYHRTQHRLQQVRAAYQQGTLTLNQLADEELQAYASFATVRSGLHADQNLGQTEMLDQLDERLADKLFCNFSLFQSMPDVWGIQQIFPIMPIHRLDETICRRAIIQDLTCDSDGRIDRYIDGQSIKQTLPIPDYPSEQPYLIGFFLLGAYQEILGDMHNLFGDTHAVNINSDENGEYQITDERQGDLAADLLRYVHLDAHELQAAFKCKLTASKLEPEQRRQYEQAFNQGLNDTTYLKTQ